MANPMQTEAEEAVEVELEPQPVEESAVEEVSEAESPTEEAKSDSEEIEDYSDSVKKRINKLTYKIREAERREAAAIDYAKGVQEKLNNTQASLSQKDKNLYDEYSARVASQLSSAEDRYKKAHDIGDSEEMLALHKKL